MENKLFFGDNLDIIKELYNNNKDGFIDLIYIDPPFNSKRNYNILFEEADLKDAIAQKEAFADTWSNVSYKDIIHEIQEVDLDLFNFIKVLDNIRGAKSAVAYLTTMAIRIFYMHKVLKDSGSFYLHCDPTMSHYLKLICDLIFGKDNFRNEIVWKRTFAHNDPQRFGKNSDRILFYSKSQNFYFNPVFIGYDDEYIRKFFRHHDDRGQYRDVILTGAGVSLGESNVEWKGYTPSNSKRHWSVPKRIVNKLAGVKKAGELSIKDKLDLLYENDYIKISKNGVPSFKQYLSEMEGVRAQEIWDDISPLSAQAKERLGYPTQKPEELLERIINASSQEGDIVADFFCGCGTTVAVAQRLKRKWIGVDISHLSIGLIEKRLRDTYGIEINSTYEVFGLPKDIASAKQLASGTDRGRLKFQDWIIETMIGGICNPKKTADGGWDGHLTFYKTEKEKELVLIEVKSGNVNVKNLREFIQVVNRQEASIGVFVCFEEQLTKPMIMEAKEQGYYEKELFKNRYDKIQILTVEDLLGGKNVEIPTSTKGIFKSANKKKDGSVQGTLI